MSAYTTHNQEVDSFDSPKVSVVIVTKNEEEAIEKCLTSVFNQSVKPLDVIVVDGRSTDDTVEKARKFPVKILVETGLTSPYNARNLGVQHANGEIVLIMGADTELDRDCLKNAMKYFQDPTVLVVIPSLEIKVHTHLEKIQAKWFYGTRSPLRGKHATGFSTQFIRKNVYTNIKFDPSLGYGDDGDFRKRLQQLYKGSGIIARAYKSKIFIDLPHSLRELSSQYIWYGRTFLRYFIRYHSLRAILRLGNLLMPTILLFLCFATLIFPSITSLLILVLVLSIIKNAIACYRSKSAYFFEFVFFDFARSLFFA